MEALRGKDGVEVVKLSMLNVEKDLVKVISFENLSDGRYLEERRENRICNHNSLKYIPDDANTRDQLQAAGFFREQSERFSDQLFALSGVNFSCASSDAATFVAGNGNKKVYVPAISGRIAKCCSINIVRTDCEEVDEGYILPFPHSAGNFYHSLYEMGYGLRHLDKFDARIRIYHGKDRFGLIPFFSKLFEIDIDRFVDVSKTPTRIRLGFSPGPMPFYCTSHAFDFFRSNFAQRMTSSAQTPEEIYISRKCSKRSLPGEQEIEDRLSGLGFAIIYAERLSVESQAELFFNAKTIVSPHGAGWTNMFFCNGGVKFVEVFEEDMLSPDFCMRSKFVTRDYTAVLQKKSERVEDTVDNIIRALES